MPIIQTENGYIYKKNKKKTGLGKGVKTFVAFFLIVAVVTICLYVFSIFDVTSVFGLNKYKIYNKTSYYGVYVAMGSSHAEVDDYIDDIKSIGGSGYIYVQNKNYYCLASIYLSKSDAEKVCENLSENFFANIIQIELKDLVVEKSYTKEELNCLKKSLMLVNQSSEELYNLSISFDKKELLEAEAKQKLQVFRETCQMQKESLSKTFSEDCDNLVTNVKIFQSEVIYSLSALLLSDNFSVDIKWTMASVINNFANMQISIT